MCRHSQPCHREVSSQLTPLIVNDLQLTYVGIPSHMSGYGQHRKAAHFARVDCLGCTKASPIPLPSSVLSLRHCCSVHASSWEVSSITLEVPDRGDVPQRVCTHRKGAVPCLLTQGSPQLSHGHQQVQGILEVVSPHCV